MRNNNNFFALRKDRFHSAPNQARVVRHAGGCERHAFLRRGELQREGGEAEVAQVGDEG
jgi:hypothetical protein